MEELGTLESVAEEPSPSIADHAASFGPQKVESPDDAPESSRVRHRAQSQQASAADVPQIQELTKQVRAKEAELLKLKPDAGKDSPRVAALRRQIRGLEAELTDATPKASVVAPVAERPAALVVTSAVSFTETEPTLEQFSDQDDPWTAWQRALGRYDRRKDAFEEKQQAAQQQQTQQQTADEQARAEYGKKIQQDYQTRAQAFEKTQPGFFALVTQRQQEQYDVPAIVAAAVMKDDNGPAMLYALLHQPDEVDRLWLANGQTPITDQNIVAMQRYLTTRLPAAVTGSAAGAPRPLAPRPPNPVRTGPMKTGDEPPSEGASIAEHAKFYAPSRR